MSVSRPGKPTGSNQSLSSSTSAQETSLKPLSSKPGTIHPESPVCYLPGKEWEAFYVPPTPSKSSPKLEKKAYQKAYTAKSRALKWCLDAIFQTGTFERQCAVLLSLL